MEVNSENGNVIFHLLSSYVLFLFSLQVISTGLSLLQVSISPGTARAILGVSIAIGLAFLFHDKELIRSISFSKNLRTWQLLFLGFLVFAGMTYILLWAAAYIMPDLSYDGNAYHIPTISMWDARGYVSWVNTPYLDSNINGFPKGAELVAYILVKAFNNNIINGVNLVFLPLGVLGIAFLARSLGAGRYLSLCAGAAFILIPVNINQSVTTYIDTAYASCAIGMIAALVKMSKQGRREWKGIFIFGATLGLALSTKSTGFALSGFAMLAFAVILIMDIGFPSPIPEKTNQQKKSGKILFRILSPLLAIGIVAIAGGGYWYIRNYLMTGTPLYPVGVTILGYTLFPGITISEVFNPPPIQLRNLLPIVRVFYTWAQGLKAWPLSIKGYDSRLGGLGYLWLFACLPSVGISLFSLFSPKLSADKKRILFLLICVIGAAFIITPLNYWARYTIWIYGLGLPCFAFALSRTVLNNNAISWQKVVSSIWLIFSLGLLLFEASYSAVDVIALASPGSLRNSLANIFKPGTWEWPTSYLFPDMRDTVLENVLTEPGTVVIGPHGDMELWRYQGMIGELSQPIGIRHLEIISESQGISGLFALVDVKYILWDETMALPPNFATLADSITPAGGYLVLTLH